MPQEVKKTGFKRTVSSVLWVVKIFWKTNPNFTSVIVLTGILTEIIAIVSNYVFAKGIDALISVSRNERDITWMYFVVAIFFALTIIQSAIRMSSNYASRIMSHIFYAKFQQLLYEKLIKLGIGDLENPETNNLIDRAKRSAADVERQFTSITIFIGVIVSLITTSSILLVFAPHFIPLFVVTLIPSLLLDRKYLSKIWQYNRDLTEGRRRANESAGHLLSSSSLHELKITAGYKFLSKNFERFIGNSIDGLRKIRSRWYKFVFGFRFVRSLVEAYADFYVFVQFLQNKITIGNVTFYIRQASSFMENLSALASQLNTLYEGSLTISETQQLFEMEEEADGKVKMDKLSIGPEISFEDINFSYPKSKREVIKNLSLNIKSGEKIAIVGHNGAGKTTLVKLLLRFYRVGSGEIKVNGTNLNDLYAKDYYKNVSILFQDFNTYSQLSVKDNIAIGKISRKATKKGVKKAAVLADVNDFVTEYEKGYDQILSEKYKGGIRPSTGQWQKIAIARFFYRNSPLVIFDEPTASIDAVSEQKIFNKIYKFFKNKTVIIISHRFSTVRNADRIIVFDKGRIVEQGSHENLMGLNGSYAKAFRLQAEGYK